jgi:hypothetical protein
MQNPRWLAWARRFQAIAQIGIEYCKDPFDRQRYEEIREPAAEITAMSAGLPDATPLVELFKKELCCTTPKIDIRMRWFAREPFQSRGNRQWRGSFIESKRLHGPVLSAEANLYFAGIRSNFPAPS